MDWELNIKNWQDFEKMVQNLSLIRPDIHKDENRIDFIRYLKFVYPNVPVSQLGPIQSAFERSGKDQVVRVAWNPIIHPDSPHNTPTLVCPVPAEWGVGDGVNYFHGTNPFNLVDMRNRHVVPSAKMAGMKEGHIFPVVCASKQRDIPFNVYAKDAKGAR